MSMLNTSGNAGKILRGQHRRRVFDLAFTGSSASCNYTVFEPSNHVVKQLYMDHAYIVYMTRALGIFHFLGCCPAL